MTNNPILIDSSFLYAVYSVNDRYHPQAMSFIETLEGTPVVPEIALVEVGFLFMRDVGYHGVVDFLNELGSTEVSLLHLTIADIRRAQEIMATYATSEFDLVDACIMALSERLQITQVCTFDRRDFSIFRPRHCDYLELLP